MTWGGGILLLLNPWTLFVCAVIPRCTFTIDEMNNFDTCEQWTTNTPCLMHDNTETFASGRQTNTLYGQAVSVGQIIHGSKSALDGAFLAVQKINELNDGKGFHVGYSGKQFLRFRYMAVVLNNIELCSSSQDKLFEAQHGKYMNELLQDYNVLLWLGGTTAVYPHEVGENLYSHAGLSINQKQQLTYK